MRASKGVCLSPPLVSPNKRFNLKIPLNDSTLLVPFVVFIRILLANHPFTISLVMDSTRGHSKALLLLTMPREREGHYLRTIHIASQINIDLRCTHARAINSPA